MGRAKEADRDQLLIENLFIIFSLFEIVSLTGTCAIIYFLSILPSDGLQGKPVSLLNMDGPLQKWAE